MNEFPDRLRRLRESMRPVRSMTVTSQLMGLHPHDTYFVINSNSATMYHKMGIFAMNEVESDNGTNKYTAEQILEITKKAFEA